MKHFFNLLLSVVNAPNWIVVVSVHFLLWYSLSPAHRKKEKRKSKKEPVQET